MDTLFDPTHILAYAVAGVTIGIFVLIFYNRVIYYRQQDANALHRSLNAQLAVVMKTCQVHVWIFNVQTRHFSLLSENGDIEDTYLPIDFSQFYNRDDFDQMRQCVINIRNGLSTTETVRVRGPQPKTDSLHLLEGQPAKVRQYEIILRLLENDREGLPLTIIGLQRDVTDTIEKHDNVENLMMRFHTLFNSSDVDMLYYDKDGWLVDINNTACRTFGIADRRVLLQNPPNLKDIPAYKNLNIKDFPSYRMSSITDIDEVRRRGESKVPAVTIGGRIYYDTIVNPIYDKLGKMIGIYTAGRSINEMVE